MSDEIKNGRPRKYETVEEMEEIMEEYFNFCDNRVQQVYSKKQDDVIEVINPAPYTMAGLARRLDMDRRALLDYKGRKDKNGKDFLPAIKRARDRVQEDVEVRLMEGQPTGAIFNLKNNFDYKDKSEVDGTQKLIVETRKAKRFKAKVANAVDNTDD